jgi:putative oxidoreductase
MNQLRPCFAILARVLIVAIFLANGFGLISQSLAVHDMVARGIPANLASRFVLAGQAVQMFAGLGLAFGLYRRICAVALVAFLVPATLIAHAFWMASGPLFQIQLLNFLKNLSMIDGLLFIATLGSQSASAEVSLVPVS